MSELHRKGLLYQGHKVVWWWPQGGTALSAGEVGLGYKTVDDPSVYVAFPLIGHDDLSLLVWTTTPWTLPSNMYAAVHRGFDYVVVRAEGGKRFVVAKALRDALEKKIGPLEVERELKGRELEGWEYEPPFDLFRGSQRPVEARTGASPKAAYWRVVLADFVTLDAGTGVVHIAPAFGEDDHKLFVEEERRLVPREGASALDLLCAVRPDGTFMDGFERYAGRWVKDCDKEIQHDLKDKGLLVHAETYRHDYPFCWRADSDPLIQYARPAWYIRTTALIDRAIANNRTIRWLPSHIQEGRFGDFLAHNVDWALSRERWWGTPLNVWICDGNPEHKHVPPSVADIEKRNPKAFDHFHAARRADPGLSEHLMVHKPWVDQVTFPCEACGETMRRVPEVVDCWFDSGCMPFAQWGYPHRGRAEFERSFPADFISEAIDQTRGWFYSLLMVSTLVFDEATYPHPFKTCIVLGHVTDKEGKKESKSRGNYTPPEIILDKVAMEFAVSDGGKGPPPRATPSSCRARTSRAWTSSRGPACASTGATTRAAGSSCPSTSTSACRVAWRPSGRRAARGSAFCRARPKASSPRRSRASPTRSASPSKTRRPPPRAPTRSAGSSTRRARRGLRRGTRSRTCAPCRRSSRSSSGTSTRFSRSTRISTASFQAPSRRSRTRCGRSSTGGSWESSPTRSASSPIGWTTTTSSARRSGWFPWSTACPTGGSGGAGAGSGERGGTTTSGAPTRPSTRASSRSRS